jgi:hypothetical protein
LTSEEDDMAFIRTIPPSHAQGRERAMMAFAE